MSQTTFTNEVNVIGNLSCKTFNVSTASITNAMVSATAAIAATKLQGEFTLRHTQTSTVAAATEYLRIIRGATGTIVDIEACITETIATGADRTVTIDLLKSTGAGAFATVLSSTIVFNNASVLRTITTGTISSASLVDGDILQLTVAVAGAAGNQAEGLIVTVTLREDASA